MLYQFLFAFGWSKFRFQLLKKWWQRWVSQRWSENHEMRGMCFSPVISAMIRCQVQLSIMLYVSYPLISFPTRMNLFCSRITFVFLQKNRTLAQCNVLLLYSFHWYIQVCASQRWSENYEMRCMYFSPIITAMICCEVKISVLLYVSDPLIPFPVCMNLFYLCIRFVLWQKNQSLSQCIVLLL